MTRTRSIAAFIVCSLLGATILWGTPSVATADVRDVNDDTVCPQVERTPPSPASTSVGSVSSAAAVGSGLGSFLGDLAVGVLGDVISGGITDVAGDAVGWVVNDLTGGGTSQPPASVDPALLKDVQGVQTQLQNLQGEVAGLSSQISDVETQIINADNKNAAYGDYLQAATKTDALATVINDVSDVCFAQHDLVVTSAQSGMTSPLDEVDASNLHDVLTSGRQNLADLNELLVPANGAPGLIELYQRVLWFDYKTNPPSGTIASSDLLNKTQMFVSFYAGLATMHLAAYAEAVHAGIGGESVNLQDYYSDYTQDLQQWSYLANYNLPALPAGVSVDISAGASPNPGSATTPGALRLWTSGPTKIAGLNQGNYCAQAGMCVAPTWDPAGATMVDNAVVPAVSSLSAYLAAPQLGLSGWRAPSVADWTTLITNRDFAIPGAPPASSSPPALDTGVAAWAAGEALPVLSTQNISYPTGSVTTLPPMVVDDPSAQAVTLNSVPFAAPVPISSPSGQPFSYGGVLALVQDIPTNPVSVPDFPSADPQQSGVPTTAPVAADVRSSPEQASVSGTGIADNLAGHTFRYVSTCGSDLSFVQPTGANAIQVTVAGAAGGNGSLTRGDGVVSGGSGGVITATFPVAAGTTLYVGVGGMGGQWNAVSSDGIGGPGGVGGGGNGGSINGSSNGSNGQTGAGGGGLSEIALDPTCTIPLAVAGGGGGAGNGIGTNDSPGGAGGNACMSEPSCDGSSGGGQDPAGGGTLTSGGSAAGNASPQPGGGAAPNGAAGGNGGAGGVPNKTSGQAGGGGGGGFTGGGGGGGATSDSRASQASGGGAGGSNFLANGATSSSFSATGTGDGYVSITPLVLPEWGLAVGFPDINIVTAIQAQASDFQPNVSLTQSAPDLEQLTDATGWAFLPSTAEGLTSVYDPEAQLCLALSVVGATEDTCGSTAPGSEQGWTITPQAVPAAYAESPYYDITSANGTALTTTLGALGYGVLLAPAQLWNADPRLTDGESSPEPPGEPSPSPTDPGSTGPGGPSNNGGDAHGRSNSSGVLAATGHQIPAGLVVLSLLVIGGGAALLARKRLTNRKS